MATDHIRYDILAQEALRGLVRTVLADAAVNGLPGDHHFYITFATGEEGVQVSARMRAQYPQEMTVVLQHQFWDLVVNDDGFEVGLSFGGVAERLVVPFAAIKSFVDPSVQFALQFQEVDTAEAETETPAAPAKKPSAKPRTPAKQTPAKGAPTVTPPAAANPPEPQEPPKPPEGAGGGEVVRLDRFRKK